MSQKTLQTDIENGTEDENSLSSRSKGLKDATINEEVGLVSSSSAGSEQGMTNDLYLQRKPNGSADILQNHKNTPSKEKNEALPWNGKVMFITFTIQFGSCSLCCSLSTQYCIKTLDVKTPIKLYYL